MKSWKEFFVLGLVLAVGLLLATGCANHPTEQIAHAETSSATPATEECSPVKVAVFSDQTASITWTRTPQLALGDLNPLTELLQQCGGELGLGLVRDDSNKSLIRLRIDPPPAKPRERNALRRSQRIRKYQAQEQIWFQETGRRMEEFHQRADPILSHRPDARRTDIWGAVQRADLFLAEDDATWGSQTHRWAVFITDGKHNTRSSFQEMRSQAQVIVVNGSASLGVMDRLRPQRFESPNAAFDYLIATEKK